VEASLKELKRQHKIAVSLVKRRNDRVREYDRLRGSLKSSGSSGYEAKRLLKAKADYEEANRECKASLPHFLGYAAKGMGRAQERLTAFRQMVQAHWFLGLEELPFTGNVAIDKLAAEIQALQKKNAGLLAGIPDVSDVKLGVSVTSLEAPMSPKSPKDVPTAEIETECRSPAGGKPMLSATVERSFTIEKKSGSRAKAKAKAKVESSSSDSDEESLEEADGRRSFEDLHKEQAPTSVAPDKQEESSEGRESEEEMDDVRKRIGRLKLENYANFDSKANKTAEAPPLPSGKNRVAALAAQLEASKIIFRPMLPGAKLKPKAKYDDGDDKEEEDDEEGKRPFMGGSFNPFARKYPKRKKLEVPPKPVKKTYVVALFDFRGQAKGDLSFKKDDKIELLTATECHDDWWTGRLRGTIGVFPANYTAKML
jgi:hypothetical protein